MRDKRWLEGRKNEHTCKKIMEERKRQRKFQINGEKTEHES